MQARRLPATRSRTPAGPIENIMEKSSSRLNVNSPRIWCDAEVVKTNHLAGLLSVNKLRLARRSGHPPLTKPGAALPEGSFDH